MENLLHRKKRFEGYRNYFYYDTRGNLTAFWGHNFSFGVISNKIKSQCGISWVKKYPLPEEVGELFLHEDTISSLKNIIKVFGLTKFGMNDITNERLSNLEALECEFPYEVLTVMEDMMFNMGMSRFLKFKRMIKAVKEGDYYEAAKEIKWTDAKKQEKLSLYYAQINILVRRLEDKGVDNTFHRAEENISLMIKAAK